MITYRLFKTQSMLLSTPSRQVQPDGNLHAVNAPEHALVSNQQARLAKW